MDVLRESSLVSCLHPPSVYLFSGKSWEFSESSRGKCDKIFLRSYKVHKMLPRALASSLTNADKPQNPVCARGPNSVGCAPPWLITPEVVFTWKPRDMPSCCFHSLVSFCPLEPPKVSPTRLPCDSFFLPLSYAPPSLSAHGHCGGVVRHGAKGCYKSPRYVSVSILSLPASLPYSWQISLPWIELHSIGWNLNVTFGIWASVATCPGLSAHYCWPNPAGLCFLHQLSPHLTPVVLVVSLVPRQLSARNT